MFGIADYGAFIVAFIILLFIPGPGNLAIITSTTKGGLKGGLAAYPTAFRAVQWLGAGYLAWLGLQMLTAKPGAAPIVHIKSRHYFQQALTITVLNPKAIVFYMAFFPLFIDPAHHQGVVTFGVMAVTLALLYCLAVLLLPHFLAERLRANPLISRSLEKLAGLFLIGFGIKLALSR